MSIDESQVLKIAKLAKLNINSNDVPKYTQNLQKILSFVEEMNEIDTTNIQPMTSPMNCKQRLRPDEVSKKENGEQLLSIAPLTEKNLYLVPKIIHNE